MICPLCKNKLAEYKTNYIYHINWFCENIQCIKENCCEPYDFSYSFKEERNRNNTHYYLDFKYNNEYYIFSSDSFNLRSKIINYQTKNEFIINRFIASQELSKEILHKLIRLEIFS